MGGAEAPTLRKRLLQAGVTRVSFNYYALRERTTTPNLDSLVTSDTDIVLYSGTSSANDNIESRTSAEWGQYLDDYLLTVQDNIERVDLAVEFAFDGLGLQEVQALRSEFWEQLPGETWAPIWMPGERLEALAESHARVVVPTAALTEAGESEEFARQLRTMSLKYGTRFHLMGALQEVWAKVGQVDSITTSAWTAATRFGETTLWDGHTVRRIPKEEKETARRRYKHLIEALDCDVEKVQADDNDEVSRLAIKSILAWEERYGAKTVSDTKRVERHRANSESTALVSATKGEVERKIEMPEGKRLLPVMDYVQRVDQTGEHDPEVRSRSDTLRKCDNCPVAPYCPEFTPGADCAYEIPVKIRTKEQLLAVMTTLVEIQGQRALFSRFMEELEGGAPNSKTSSELERFFQMSERMKSIADDRDFMRITVEGHANGGVISRLFGDKAGETAQALPAPIDSEDVIEAVIESGDD